MKYHLTLILFVTCIMSCVLSMQPQQPAMKFPTSISSQQPIVLTVTLHTGATINFTKEDLLYKFNDLCDAQPESLVLFDSKHNHVLPTHPHEPKTIKHHILSQLAAVTANDKPEQHFLEVDYALLGSKPVVIANEAFEAKREVTDQSTSTPYFNSAIFGYVACILSTYLITKRIYTNN